VTRPTTTTAPRRSTWFALVLLVASALAAGGCGGGPPKKNYDAYLRHMPTSVVVLPPLNESTNVRAPDAFLATVTVPLAERGYYVFPVALVDTYMKENGLPTPGEMHQVAPSKLRDVFGADAVLYITIKRWTSQYLVINNSTSVTLAYRLVDTRSGELLWRDEQTVEDSSGGGSWAEMMISAGAHALTNLDGHREAKLAALANQQIIHDPNRGMLYGAYHKSYAADQKRRGATAARSGMETARAD
jgi:hypothetical protein